MVRSTSAALLAGLLCLAGAARPAAAECGDGVIDPDEACDGEDLAGNTCASLGVGFTGGTLACTSACALDTTQCTVAPCPLPSSLLELNTLFDASRLGDRAQARYAEVTQAGVSSCQLGCGPGAGSSDHLRVRAEPGTYCTVRLLGDQAGTRVLLFPTDGGAAELALADDAAFLDGLATGGVFVIHEAGSLDLGVDESFIVEVDRWFSGGTFHLEVLAAHPTTQLAGRWALMTVLPTTITLLSYPSRSEAVTMLPGDDGYGLLNLDALDDLDWIEEPPVEQPGSGCGQAGTSGGWTLALVLLGWIALRRASAGRRRP
jgi:hypothetical protein